MIKYILVLITFIPIVGSIVSLYNENYMTAMYCGVCAVLCSLAVSNYWVDEDN